MRKVLVVAVREFQAAVKTKAFILTMLAMPVFMFASFGIQLYMRDKVDITEKRVAVLDYSPGGKLFDALVDASAKREIHKGEGEARRQVKPKFVIERTQGLPEDALQAALAMSDRVRKREIFAFLIIGADAIQSPSDTSKTSVEYYSNSPTYDDFVDWARDVLNREITNARFATLNLDRELVEKATRRTWIANLGLVSQDSEGKIVPAERTNELANIFVPMGMMMLMFMAVMVGATPLTQSVIEEKMARIAEVLLGSIRPFDLMLGKLLGTVGVSLTIVTFYLVGGFVAINRAGYGQFFPVHAVWWFVVFQSLAVLLYGSIFTAIGAAVSDMKEAQSIITPVMLVLVAPMFVWLNVVKEPSSTLSVALSLIPPATPMLMTLRQAVPPGVPFWQPALGVVLVLITTLICVFAAGRIFRVGLLMQGRGAKLGEMLRWVVKG